MSKNSVFRTEDTEGKTTSESILVNLPAERDLKISNLLRTWSERTPCTHSSSGAICYLEPAPLLGNYCFALTGSTAFALRPGNIWNAWAILQANEQLLAGRFEPNSFAADAPSYEMLDDFWVEAIPIDYKSGLAAFNRYKQLKSE